MFGVFSGARARRGFGQSEPRGRAAGRLARRETVSAHSFTRIGIFATLVHTYSSRGMENHQDFLKCFNEFLFFKTTRARVARPTPAGRCSTTCWRCATDYRNLPRTVSGPSTKSRTSSSPPRFLFPASFEDSTFELREGGWRRLRVRTISRVGTIFFSYFFSSPSQHAPKLESGWSRRWGTCPRPIISQVNRRLGNET